MGSTRDFGLQQANPGGGAIRGVTDVGPGAPRDELLTRAPAVRSILGSRPGKIRNYTAHQWRYFSSQKYENKTVCVCVYGCYSVRCGKLLMCAVGTWFVVVVATLIAIARGAVNTTGDVLEISGFHVLCKTLANSVSPIHTAIKVRGGCSAPSTGNNLASIYMSQVASIAAGLEFRSRCDEQPDPAAV